MAQLPEIKDATFETEVLRSEGPVLVDFGAEWCHPCRQLDPIVEELAGTWKGRARVVHIDADENVETTTRFGVLGLPTLILFRHGEPVGRLQGFQSKKRIQDLVEPHLGSAT
jgi:thioredoxin 1